MMVPGGGIEPQPFIGHTDFQFVSTPQKTANPFPLKSDLGLLDPIWPGNIG